MTLLEFLLILVLALLAFFLIRFLIKRISLLYGILSLKKISGVELEEVNHLAFFTPKTTSRPAALIRVNEKRLTLRLFSGKSKRHAVHLASEKYAATFFKMGGKVRLRQISRIFVRAKAAVVDTTRVYFPKTHILPAEEIKASEGSVIIFSPAPSEVTYVTPAKNSIDLALTGDRVFGSRVFTKTTFINYVDRLSRDPSLSLDKE